MIKCFRTRLLMLTFGFRNKWGIMERWREWRIFHQSRKQSYMDARLNLTDFVFLSTHIWEKTAVMSPFSRVPYTQPLPLDQSVCFFSAKHQAPAAGYSRVALSIMDRVEQVIKELVPLTCEDWGWNTVGVLVREAEQEPHDFCHLLYSMEKRPFFGINGILMETLLIWSLQRSLFTRTLFNEASNVTSAFGFPGNLQNCDWLGKLCDLDASGFPWNCTIKKMYLFHRDRKGVLDILDRYWQHPQWFLNKQQKSPIPSMGLIYLPAWILVDVYMVNVGM